MKQANPPFYQKNFQLPAVPGGTVQPKREVPWQFGMNQRIQANRVKTSQVNVFSAVAISGTAFVIGTIGAGSTQVLTTTLTPQPPHGTEINFAIPYIAFYEGTTNVTNNLIFPGIGANKAWGSYSFQEAMDWDDFSTTIPGSIVSAYRITIHNNMGVAGTYFAVSQWKYLNINSGTVA